MSNVASLPRAVSQGGLTPLGTESDGGAAPIPPVGSVEAVDGSGVAYKLRGSRGITVTKVGDVLDISMGDSADIDPDDIIPGQNDQVLATEAGVAGWQTVVAPPTVAMAALNVDWSKGYVFSKTLAAGANALTFSNTKDGQTITVAITGAASTLTFPSVKWAGGSAPTQTASGTDVYTFVNIGGTIYGSVVQNMS